ncbi:hypothetical protein PCASD_26586 [Puccinia coronata f. sp. avenae]|uniref:Uncharacterized protein n=1 Tax=Puccinia coronata f. sp. avenae TaxID=200324 RepID=A0A2N5RXA1_9BASI|nr:hypothetical protein PCASD_26848 [Puccinia coronata f. sp. avenae]PLW26679.1 hypothetical protein PCASD_26586 [Puccinia coronata f. sp. avenae]
MLDKAKNHAQRCMDDEFQYSKERWDKKHKLTTFKIGDLVLISTVKFNNIKGPKKLKNGWHRGATHNKLIPYQLAGSYSRQADTVPACWELLLTSWYRTSLLGATPNEVVLYQLAGSYSQQAGTVPVCSYPRKSGTVPARWELLLTSWYSPSSLGATPNKLVQSQLAGSYSRQAGTVSACWELLPLQTFAILPRKKM